MAKELSISEKARICQESFFEVNYHICNNEMLDLDDYECPDEDELLNFAIEILKKLNFTCIKAVRNLEQCNCILQIIIERDLSTRYSMFDFCSVKYFANFQGEWNAQIGKGKSEKLSLSNRMFSIYIPYSKEDGEYFSFNCKPKTYFLAIE